MSEEEQSELFKKAFTNTLRKLAEEPEELFDNDKLRKKYNNLLKEQIKLKQQLQQKENIIKEAREKVHDIYFRIDNIPQNHWIGIKLDVTNQGQELLEILDKVKEG